MDLEATIVAKYVVMAPLLDERARRLWAAAESVAIGYGGDALVSSATCTNPTRVWISRSSKRGPAAARNDATLASVAAESAALAVTQ